jgi:hypothetical protein
MRLRTRRRMSFPSPGALFASLLFSAIGMGALVYAKKMSAFKPALLGVALMAYPYFLSDNLLLWGVGIALTIALFVFNG